MTTDPVIDVHHSHATDGDLTAVDGSSFPIERAGSTSAPIEAWSGGLPLADTLPLPIPTVAWAVVAVSPASRMFRWEPRR